MWTATILNSVNKGLTTDVAVSFTNGTSTYSTTFQDLSDPSSVTDLIASQISQLAAKDANPVQTGLVTIPVPAAPSQADTSRSAFLANWRKLQAMQRAQSAGIVGISTAVTVAALNAAWDPSYLDYV